MGKKSLCFFCARGQRDRKTISHYSEDLDFLDAWGILVKDVLSFNTLDVAIPKKVSPFWRKS